MSRITIIFGSILLFIFISSCKKGEDDPAISLRSRKARITGNWKLESGSLLLRYKSNSNLPDETFDYTNDGFVYTSQGANGAGNHSLELTFTKDGAFEFKQIYNSTNFTGAGTWDFLGAIGKDKKKERVAFKINNLSGGSNNLDLFNKAITYFNYRIVELRKDKLVLEAKDELIEKSSQDSVSYYVTSRYTLVK